MIGQAGKGKAIQSIEEPLKLEMDSQIISFTIIHQRKNTTYKYFSNRVNIGDGGYLVNNYFHAPKNYYPILY